MFTWRHQYDAEADAVARKATDIDCGTESKVQAQFKDDQDLNVIVSRFGVRDGAMPVPPVDPAGYGDFSDLPDLRQVLDIQRDARERWMALPGKVRSRFDNDMVEFLEFIHDPENALEAQRMGLLRIRAPEVPEVRLSAPGGSQVAAPVPVAPVVPPSGGAAVSE